MQFKHSFKLGESVLFGESVMTVCFDWAFADEDPSEESSKMDLLVRCRRQVD